ncbi:SRPBCC domain-containing protein [Paramicrobacterium agarici]|uniref:SRPBCC domain-containing protein n=1 Tax=Paramicrobacterium agarici TaxID=630514 RepID=UPI0011522324|nr:SRPBCC domain-containing protein [Microbacterium agarici]TQO23164.1 uncharacterized protein YndB with AHSA1/START domain [Microbacterium agarici]
MEEFDSIERNVHIAATPERVWELISEPGWYINDGELREHRIERRGDITIVHDNAHGAFAFLTVALDEPRYAAFRWLQDANDERSPSTLVEFRIAEQADGVKLTVTESGFAALPGTAEERRREFDENAEGWEQEVALAKSFAERA